MPDASKIASVHLGTRRDAVLFSVGANSGHGLQRTNADKREAVMTLLGDAKWSKSTRRSNARFLHCVDCRTATTYLCGVLAYGKRYVTYRGATEEAEAQRARLIAEGWRILPISSE